MNRFIYSIFILLLLAGCDGKTDSPDPAIPAGSVQVRGHLIDVRPFASGAKVYPQHDGYSFPDGVEALWEDGMSYAVSLKENAGPEAVRSGNDGAVMIAVASAGYKAEGWTLAEKTFSAGGDIVYYVYEHACKANEWVSIPAMQDDMASVMVIAPEITVQAPAAHGTVIAKVPALARDVISNASIVILPNGEYLASCTGIVPGEASLFLSGDRGATWSMLIENLTSKTGIRNYYNLFLHEGALYMMGCEQSGNRIMISKSEDNGRTWTKAEDGTSGVLFEGLYHSAVVPVAIHDGRIYRGFETQNDMSDTDASNDRFRPFVVSAPVGSDLLDASNWTMSEKIARDGDITVIDSRITQTEEGNVVVGPDGQLNYIFRYSSTEASNYAGIATVTSPATISYSDGAYIRFPGGGKKFTIRYDEVSGKYWSITNPAARKHSGHDGIYRDGLTVNLVRNRMTLCCSDDLKTWIPVTDIVSDEDPFFHGFQYVDWLVDGDDIVAVCRQACPEERGLPVRQHDANMLTFYRISSFRNLIP